MQEAYELLWKSIGTEWLGVLIVFAASILLIILTIVAANRVEGWDAIGLAIILNGARVCGVAVAGLFFFVWKPLQIITEYREALFSIEPLGKRILTNGLVWLPILLYILYVLIWAYVFFHRKIERAFRRFTDGNRNKNASRRSTKEETFRGFDLEAGKNTDASPQSEEEDLDKEFAMSPRDFIAILDERGLTEENGGYELMDAMNEKYRDVIEERNEEFFYTKAIMMPLRRSRFQDSFGNTKFWRHPSEKMWPAYVYNAILICPGKGDRLRYAPFARYAQQKNAKLSGRPAKDLEGAFPYDKDLYVECKLLCVDTQIYAIIGVGESLCVKRHCRSLRLVKPYYLILSEKDTITTRVDGVYDPDGAIEAVPNGFVMRGSEANTPRYKKKQLLYPVRKVDRIDIDTINAVAAELQELIGCPL